MLVPFVHKYTAISGYKHQFLRQPARMPQTLKSQNNSRNFYEENISNLSSPLNDFDLLLEMSSIISLTTFFKKVWKVEKKENFAIPSAWRFNLNLNFIFKRNDWVAGRDRCGTAVWSEVWSVGGGLWCVCRFPRSICSFGTIARYLKREQT